MNVDKRMDGGTICARCLDMAGIDVVFMLHGGHLDPIFQACMDAGIRLLDTRHEAAAGHAADAYARQTGRCSVAMATAGPGFTNILTAIAQCHLDATPMLVIAGAPPLRDAERWPLQGGIDQVAMARPITKWAGQATRPELIPHLMAHALRVATEGRPGPVLLEIPIDVLFNRVPEYEVRYPDVDPLPKPAPARGQIARIVDLLDAAKRPAILCGGGMLYSGATAALRAFAEASGIPVYANNKARGVLPTSHPLCAGPHTNLAVAAATGVGAPDVLLTLGARFGMFTEPGLMGPARIPPDDCTIIQVDISGAELGRVRPAHVPVLADCGETLRALVDATAGQAWPDWSRWSRAVHNMSGWHRAAFSEPSSSKPSSSEPSSSLVHPYLAVTEVVRALGPDTIICADGGEASFWAEMAAEPSFPGQLMSHGYLGCLGIGVPFAIGAQLAHPLERVAVITGDGSAGFNLQEFDTLVRHHLPVVTIILNNRAWGMCVHGQQSMYGANRLVGTMLGDARYDLAAAGLGCHGEYVERLEDIGPAVLRALQSGLPACVNIITDLDAQPGRPAAERTTATTDRNEEIPLPYYDSIKTR
jgi:acetolactate synthase I/II/III large subunit